MNYHTKILSSLTLAAACALTAAGQTMTYADCVDYASAHNITLRKLDVARQKSLNTLSESKAQWEPTLDFSTTHTVGNTPWADGTKNTYNSSYALGAGWTVWDGGRRSAAIKRDRLQLSIDSLDTGDALRTVETEILQAYINILYAGENVEVCRLAVELSRAQAERAKALMESGKLSRVDYTQLQSQYEQDRYSLVSAEGSYNSSRMELKQILEMGIGNDLHLAPVIISDSEITATLPPIEESYDLALATDTRLKSLDLTYKSADYDISIAKAGRMPQISLSAGVGTGYYAPGGAFGTSLKQGFNENIGLTVKIPILDKRATKTAVTAARLQQVDAELDIENRRTELSRLVENWYIDTRSAQARYLAAQSQLEAASLNNELCNERFSLGYVNTVELMSAHNDYVEASRSLLQARYMALLGIKMIEYYRTATITL
ncbi:MAG: TolC family protein [Candidatus Amulumruptor sp.]|nr:TolC family protein [Candidatus Amulumruptor sp.]MDE7151463.1 TolC family protein [Candidatus Amulumruptor sp.]